MLIAPPTALAARIAGAVALAFAALGCGDQACIQKSSVKSGVCPDRIEANKVLTDGCNNVSSDGRVQSVNSDATEDGDLCCYDVTRFSQGIMSCAPRPAGGAGL